MRQLSSVFTLVALVVTFTLGSPDRAAAQANCRQPANGAVFALTGAPHLWIFEAGALHWAGDTRALAGRAVNWSSRCNVSVAELQQLQLGDPWLSAGLVKINDPIFLAKWETEEAAPALLHIQSIRDVELFGINGGNYGRFVMERAEWEQRFGFNVDSLRRGELATVAPASSGAPPTQPPVAQPTARPPTTDVLGADNFDTPTGLIPRQPYRDGPWSLSFTGGEFIITKSSSDTDLLAAQLRDTYRDVRLAVDVRVVGAPADQFAGLVCADQRPGTRNFYRAIIFPGAQVFSVEKWTSGRQDYIAQPRTSDAIRPGNETNRLELTCAAGRIGLRVNGGEIFSFTDATPHREGLVALTAGAINGPAEVHFDNLVISRA